MIAFDGEIERRYYQRARKRGVTPNERTQLYLEMLRVMGFPELPPEVAERWRLLGVPLRGPDPD